MTESITEQWRPVTGWPDYEVSDLGRVRSLKGYGGKPVRIMKPQQFKGKQYLYVLLSSGPRKKHGRIASLVAEAFIGPRPEGLEIRHLNGDAQNNFAGNLAYGTSSENKRDRIRHGTDRNVAKTHCPAGHEYTPENTARGGPDGRWRHCRACDCARHAAIRRRAA